MVLLLLSSRVYPTLTNLEHTPNGTPSPPTIRIVIADQQPIFRHGLRRLLETDPRLVIVGETHDGATAAAAIREWRPDILLLGLNASGCRALDTLREVAADGAEVRTIVLADRLGAPDVAGALQLGVRGVLPKDSTPDELFDSIHAVMAGQMWVGRAPTPTMGASLKKLKATRRQMKAFGLTQREIEIIKAVMVGGSTKGIAERSSISENTVKSHLAHIFNKMGVSNRVELVQFAAHHRLLDLI
jgi:two-component system, NarL family, nitrate/nitrite response regulator NarL